MKNCYRRLDAEGEMAKFQLDADCTVAEWLDAAGQTGQLQTSLGPTLPRGVKHPAERASAQILPMCYVTALGTRNARQLIYCYRRVPLG